MELAPICLFVYNRIDETKQCLKALQDNFLARKSILYIFSDGPKKSKEDRESINALRIYLKNEIKGFKKVEIIESNTNKGLANSIIEGVNTVLSKFEKVIVLEDDLIVTRNFLDYMNQGLSFYESNSNIISISGYTPSLKSLKDIESTEVFYHNRISSWGWAIWRDRWNLVQWDLKEDVKELKKNKTLREKFNQGGSDLSKMLINHYDKKLNSWAVRFAYHQFKYGKLTVYPVKSKLFSIGFSKRATHTHVSRRFKTNPDKSNLRQFDFKECPVDLNQRLSKEFNKKFSLLNRGIDRLLQFKIFDFLSDKI